MSDAINIAIHAECRKIDKVRHQNYFAEEDFHRLLDDLLKDMDEETVRIELSPRYWLEGNNIIRLIRDYYSFRFGKKFVPVPYEWHPQCRECNKKYIVTAKSNKEFVKICRKPEVCPDCISLEKQRIRKHILLLKRMPYAEYLKSDHWQSVRKQALERSNLRCQLCNAGNRQLHVHHRTYERRGEELWNDVITLCKDCHEKFHDIVKEDDCNE